MGENGEYMQQMTMDHRGVHIVRPFVVFPMIPKISMEKHKKKYCSTHVWYRGDSILTGIHNFNIYLYKNIGSIHRF